jgi:hypothetical protein
MRSSVLRRVAAMAVSLSVAVSSWAAPSAAADDPLFVGWAELLPALVHQYEPTSLDDCVAGRLQCVDATIRTMDKRFVPLAASCSHQAVFALAYLRTTEAYRRFSATDGNLADPTFVNHQDVAFARMYFDAYDSWAAGSPERVPPAWRIAFDAAGRDSVNGLGNLLLGMNAHVNRDLPFVLAAIGLTRPDGTSRKNDHDRIDRMLNGVVRPLIDETAATLDPSIPVLDTPWGVGYTALLQAIVGWREAAWRFAELLVAAPTPQARELVAQQIETYAAVTAQTIVLSTSYLPPLTSPVRRDAFCAGR